jgi:hypothetical protein
MLKVLARRFRPAAPVLADEKALDATSVSLTTAVPRPPSEGVQDQTVVDMLPIAKLVSGHTQTLCRIRAISAGGLAADCGADLPVGSEVHIELNAPQSIPGRVVWTRAEAVGIKFDEKVDIRALLANKASREGYQARPPRLEIDCSATIRIGGYQHQVDVRDISLGGLKVDIRDPDVLDQKALITIESLPPLKGCVRWYRDGQAGILFDKPLKFEELTAWLATRYELARNKAGAWQRPPERTNFRARP